MASDRDAADQARQSIPRREVLRRAGALGATGGIVTVAGCSGGDTTTAGDTPTETATPTETSSGGDTTEDGGDTTTAQQIVPADNSFANQTTDNLTNYQYNHLNFQQGWHHPMQFEYFQRYNIANDEYTEWGLTVEEWAPEEERAVIGIMDGLTWHNGDPVTGEDLATKFATEALINGEIAQHFTDLSVAGDRSLELTLAGAVNRSIFQEALNYYWIDTPDRKYGKYREMWRDATTDKEKADARSKMRNATFDEPFGNGPFQFESVDSNRLRMSLYEDHPHADRINFDYWDVVRVSTDTASVVLNMVPDGDVDMVRNYTAPQSVLKQKKEGHLLQYLPALWGQSLPFNCSHKWFKNIRVRQAIAEFVDRQLAARNYGEFGQPVEAPSGLVGNIAGDNSKSDRWKQWVSNEGAKELHRYRNKERGRRLLREQGFQKSGGTWQAPDGQPFKFSIKVPADYTDWHPIYQTVAGSLQQEGIQASIEMIDSTSYWPDHYLATNFEVASTGWTLQYQHPYYTNNMYYNIDSKFMGLGKASTVEAPPFGKPDGELRTWDIDKLMDNLRTSSPENEKEYIDKLSWVTNQMIPMLPLIEINDILWMTDDDWKWEPAKDDPVWQAKWPQWWFPRMGLMGAKDEDEAM
ncbi:MAG: ABC transporter substrate-binding protein [Halorhabdus sp.]